MGSQEVALFQAGVAACRIKVFDENDLLPALCIHDLTVTIVVKIRRTQKLFGADKPNACCM
jgi:hypothetical protein